MKTLVQTLVDEVNRQLPIGYENSFALFSQSFGRILEPYINPSEEAILSSNKKTDGHGQNSASQGIEHMIAKNLSWSKYFEIAIKSRALGENSKKPIESCSWTFESPNKVKRVLLYIFRKHPAFLKNLETLILKDQG